MPVFGGGRSRFQPVYVGDLARLITLCSYSPSSEVASRVNGAIIEAGGPESKLPHVADGVILTCCSLHL
jgi:NADH dehydrogenase